MTGKEKWEKVSSRSHVAGSGEAEDVGVDRVEAERPLTSEILLGCGCYRIDYEEYYDRKEN